MKNLVFITVCVITVILMTNCKTVPVNTEPEILLISHSLGYQYHSQEGDLRKDDRPDWFPPKFNEWKAEKEKSDDGNFYFLWPDFSMDENSPILKKKIEEVKKQNKGHWSLQDSYDEVLRRIHVEVANQIGVKIESFIRDEQTGTVWIDETNVRSQGRESLTSINQSEATTYFEGLDKLDSFYMEFQEGRKINVAQCWSVFTIPVANFEKSRIRIEEDRKIKQNAEEARRSNEIREESIFSQNVQEHARIIRDLDHLTVAGDEIRYAIRYTDLLHVNATLAILDTLKNREDSVGKNYETFVNRIAMEINTYDPSSGQIRVIENLRTQIAQLTGQIEGLREDKLVSQQFIIPFPQRPYETRIPELNIFAANYMVSNREYISFTGSGGINSYSRREQGLDTTAVSVSWNDAARYCNFLSNFYGYTSCYTEVNRQITGYDRSKNGFRLPEFHEITTILATQPGLINEEEFQKIGIWSSDGGPSEYTVYILSRNSDPTNERLMKQSVKNSMSDPAISFRIVRNAD